MKILLPALILILLTIVLFSYNKRMASDRVWQTDQQALKQLKQEIVLGRSVGFPVDSNHLQAWYQCRYTLAPVVLYADSAAIDTQLVVVTRDGKAERNSGARLQKSDTIWQQHTASADYYLLKAIH